MPQQAYFREPNHTKKAIGVPFKSRMSSGVQEFGIDDENR
jgi:hypothetical protein